MSYVKQIYMDDLLIEEEIIYTEAEIDDMFRLHEEAVTKRIEFKRWCRENLK